MTIAFSICFKVFDLRRFMLLENVGHILSKEMAPVMKYLLEDGLRMASLSSILFSIIS